MNNFFMLDSLDLCRKGTVRAFFFQFYCHFYSNEILKN